MNREKRIVLGKLIAYYRDKSNITRKDLLYNQEKEKHICSYPTYRKLEKGEPIDKEEVYDALIRQLGYVYREFKEVDDWIPSFWDGLYNAFLSCDEKYSDELEKRVNEVFNKAKNYFYYKELYALFIFLVHTNGKKQEQISDEKYQEYKSLAELMCEEYRDIWLAVLLLYVYNISCDNIQFEELKPLIMKESSNLIMVYSQCCVLRTQDNIDLFLNKVQELLNIISREKYPNFYLRISMLKLARICYFQPQNALKEYESIKGWIEDEETKISNMLKSNFYYNYGVFSLCFKEYNRSYNLFRKYIKNKKELNNVAKCLYIISALKSNHKISFDNVKIKENMSIYEYIIRYCYLKNSGKIEDSISHLELCVIPSINETGVTPIIEFVREEVLEIVSERHSYKLLYDFESSLRKSRK